MIDNAIKEFDKFMANFDLNNSDIKRKYDHVFRVKDYAKSIIESITNDEKLISIVIISAILHDIGRFQQFSEYNTYMDYKSFDHGDRGKEILEENDYISKYVDDDYLKEVIIHTVKYHNKKDIPLTGDDFKDTVLRVVRDADKIDILFEQNNEIKNKNYVMNDNHVNSIFNEEMCDTSFSKEYDDDMFTYLAFIFDINYKKSFEIIKNKGIIDYKFNILSEYVKDDKLSIMKDRINNYINNKLGDDIKC